MPSKQKTILQAIAKEGIAQNITSAKFIKKYNLKSASSEQAAVKPLLKNDILTQSDTVIVFTISSCPNGWQKYINGSVSPRETMYFFRRYGVFLLEKHM